ncbi:MAG: ABC transporter substrate-binding protein, partial [Verrucomicrobiota bacterium]
DGEALTPVVMQTDWYAQPEHGGFYHALATGIYEEAGLQVRIAPGGPNATPVMKVARGQADFGMGRLDDVTLRIQKGLDLLIVSALMQHDPQGLLLHADNPISSLPEMDGQKIMVTPGSVIVQMMEKKFDLSIKIQPLDYGIGRFLSDPEFIQQCFVTSEPYFAKKRGVEPKVILISELGFDPYRVVYTNRTFARENPEIVSDFVAATIQGWAEYMDDRTDRESANALIVTDNQTMDDPELVQFSISAMQEYNLIHGDSGRGDANGLLRKGRIQSVIDLMQELDILDEISKAEQVYTTDFLPAEILTMLSEDELAPFE